LPFVSKYTEDDWLRTIDLIEEGHGSVAIGRALGIPRDTARSWIGRYRRFGLLGWDLMGTRKNYPFEIRLAAVKAFLGGETKPQVLARFGIRHKTQLDGWVTAYRRDGENALRPKPLGRQPADRTAPESAEQKIARLEMENAALKKLQALVAEERRRSSK